MAFDEIALKMRAESVLMAERGSVVYGTASPLTSDVDVLIVVPDTYSEFLSQFENGIFQLKKYNTYLANDEDCEYITISNFQKLLDDCTVLAIETIFTPSDHILHFDSEKCNLTFPEAFDKWKVRQEFSRTASNSWAKAHKKMTVEKDLDIRCGKKSLFHSLRILNFGIQVCERGYIYDFSQANQYWHDICISNHSWEEYKTIYKPIYNELRSKLAALAPKPV